PRMLAGWMTLEARLASAFIVLLVFAAGMMPARVQAAPAQIGLNAVPSPRSSPQGGGRENLPWPQVGSRFTLTSAEGATRFGRNDTAAMGLADTLPEPSAEPTGELTLVNQDRAQAGLPPLAGSSSLDRVAAIRASQLVVDGITHYRPGHSTLAAVELLQANHIPYVWHGENIIWEGSLPWAEVPAFFNTWWMASLAHRDNLLNPHYRSVGIGIAKNGDAVYMVEVFSDQVGDPAETPSLQGGARSYRTMSRQPTSPM
ncbi:MAG TPA: CAP domain-containing protein, partial [Candidatus Acidoferrales bacterium]|nr:CAP domain-containing protein [Candidatus Acidoferrales bacterium]